MFEIGTIAFKVPADPMTSVVSSRGTHDTVRNNMPVATARRHRGSGFPGNNIIHNEGWLLRLILDWLSRQKLEGHPLNFAGDARWYSEGLLESQFLARIRSDNLAEGWTHADGVIGQVVIGDGALANILLSKNATQFIVTEAKLFALIAKSVER